MSTASAPRPCLAVDLVQAGLDPLTGRTLSFSRLPMAVWAGHLCDLVLAGVLSPDAQTARLHDARTPPLHPLLADAVEQLARHLPTAWADCFRPTVVDLNRTVRQVQAWLVDTGVWTRRRTIFGPRYRRTSAAPEHRPPPTPAPDAGSQVRAAVLDTLVGIARLDLTTRRNSVGHIGPDAMRVVPDTSEAIRGTLIAITTTTENLIDLAHVPIARPGM